MAAAPAQTHGPASAGTIRPFRHALVIRSSHEVLRLRNVDEAGPEASRDHRRYPGQQHAARYGYGRRPPWRTAGAARTLCGLATDGLHLFADHNFETLTISTGWSRDCVAAIDTYDDSARSD